MDDKDKSKDRLLSELSEMRRKVVEMEREFRLIQDRMQDAMTQATEEKAKTEAVIAALGDGISIQNLEYRVLFQNERHKQLVGEHLGEYCYKAYQNNDSVCKGCHLTLSFKDGKIHRKEQIRVTDQGTFYYEIISSPLRNAEGTVVAGIEAVRDITDRKRMELALAESEQRYRTLFETAGDAILILDAEGKSVGKIISANRSASEMHGYGLEELLSLHIQDLDHPKSASLAPFLMKRVISGEKVKTELFHRRKDGSVFPVEVTAVLMEVKGHKYILGIDRDITERKAAELEKEHLISELKEALENIDTLKGLLPICAWCKKIRDDKGYWKGVEAYISEHSKAEFSHGICPECMEKITSKED